ncbi:hypothetical protein NPX90_00815 [Bacillus paranthracis]|nr:hypothetical protein [Bacillus paranthracis]MCU5227268.1 hypothetical protein [Bacillus paranthracis]
MKINIQNKVIQIDEMMKGLNEDKFFIQIENISSNAHTFIISS